MSQLNVGRVSVSGGIQLPSYTSSNLPTTGISPGFMIYNSTENVVKIWDGSRWKNVNESKTEGFGGEVYDWGPYRVHRFTSSGAFTVTNTSSNSFMDVMLIAGGGGGGSSSVNCSNGGGGAGGLVYRQSMQIPVGSFPVVIGAGGLTATANAAVQGTNGGDTTFMGLTAIGGGGGGAGSGVDGGRGRNGGSGGGGSQPFSGPISTGLQPSSPSGGFGRNGGAANNSGPEWGGGGGGGAGEVGQDGTSVLGGRGGNGISLDIAGTFQHYAGGGGGANCGNPVCTMVPGGLGGGGNASCQKGSDGGNGYGGGGAGTGWQSGWRGGGNGGNGVVIIKYLRNDLDPTIGTTQSNPASHVGAILAANPTASSGLYWIKPPIWSGSAQQVYCDMSDGGWMMVSSSNAASTVIPGGTGRNSSAYFLSRSGVLGTPDPNTDYIIGSLINDLMFQEVRVLAWGRGSTNGTTTFASRGTWISATWPLGTSGQTRLIEVRPRNVVTLGGNSTLSSLAAHFVLDGVQRDFVADGVFNANAQQSTIGGVGVQGVNGDPFSGCYLGHGSAEGSFEGWYDVANASADCQGYTTWVR
jgi:hypothetical protein